MTQSTVSARIQNLENSLGATCFPVTVPAPT
ncbi:MAG: LysR family transcriptional regulator [Thiolinea sp.]